MKKAPVLRAGALCSLTQGWPSSASMEFPMKQWQEVVDSFVALRVLAGLVALMGSTALVWKLWKVIFPGAAMDLGEVVYALATLFFVGVFWHFAATGRF